MSVKPFVINRYGSMVFPVQLLSGIGFLASSRRCNQFNTGHPPRLRRKGADRNGDRGPGPRRKHYKTRYEVCRDMALNLFWAQRYVTDHV